jgi:tellurite resistance protein
MTSTATTNPTILLLEKHADTIRSELRVPKQSEVFRAAVEAGYLTANADGNVDDGERSTIVRAVEILSEGAVIEWEVETLVAECVERSKTEGADKRAAQVGATLKELGQAEVGILLASVVARATKKVEKKEADVLKAVGKAAGLTNEQIASIVKRAASIAE